VVVAWIKLVIFIGRLIRRIKNMYSWEIENFLNGKNHYITPEDYRKIVTESPQINEIIYDAYDDNFIITTNDNYSWKFKIDNKTV
jgi:hypothetical protein